MEIFKYLPLQIQIYIYEVFYLERWCYENIQRLQKGHRKSGFYKVLRELSYGFEIFYSGDIINGYEESEREWIRFNIEEDRKGWIKQEAGSYEKEERCISFLKSKEKDNKKKKRIQVESPPPKRLGNSLKCSFCTHCNPKLATSLEHRRNRNEQLNEYLNTDI